MILRFGPEEVDNPQCYIENNGVVIQHKYGCSNVFLKTSESSMTLSTRDLMYLRDSCDEMIRELTKYYNKKSAGPKQLNPIAYC
jgi:hypothetical protein